MVSLALLSPVPAILPPNGRSGDADIRDFSAPKPCPYDASAGTITARGLQMLYQLLLPTEPAAAEKYLARGTKLIKDVIRECGTPAATLEGGKVNWGEGGWEPILQVSLTFARARIG